MLKLRAANNLFKNDPVELHLRTIKVNADITGASGFIRHKTTNMIVYINTENGFGLGYLYRCAKNLKDFKGADNRYAKSKEDLHDEVMKLLNNIPLNERYFGKEFWIPPKVVLPKPVVQDYQRQIPGAIKYC